MDDEERRRILMRPVTNLLERHAGRDRRAAEQERIAAGTPYGPDNIRWHEAQMVSYMNPMPQQYVDVVTEDHKVYMNKLNDLSIQFPDLPYWNLFDVFIKREKRLPHLVLWPLDLQPFKPEGLEPNKRFALAKHLLTRYQGINPNAVAQHLLMREPGVTAIITADINRSIRKCLQ